MNKTVDTKPVGRLATRCHMCKSGPLSLVLDLGLHPHSDHFPTREQVEEGNDERYPLRLVSCSDCGLLQIDYLVNPRTLYQTDYLYQSLSTTKTGSAHFQSIADDIQNKFSISDGSFVVDIGSNIGSLLCAFKDSGFRVLGVDPADGMARTATESGIPTINDFFGSHIAREIVEKQGKATVITGTNVFAHLHEIDDAVEGMSHLLAEDGVIAIEAPYVLDLIENLQYDTIYHQHIGYLSVKPMERYFRQFGLELFGIKKIPIHGGSLRYYVGHTGRHAVSTDIARFVEEEEAFGLYSPEKLMEFRDECLRQREELVALLSKLKGEGKRIAGLGAPAKGNTLLNYCDIGISIIDFVTEKNPLKVGRYTPSTHIPIYEDARLFTEKPDYALILSWNFADEIMKNLEAFKKQGGKFIIPVPKPLIV